MLAYLRVALISLLTIGSLQAQFANEDEMQDKAILNAINSYHAAIDYQSGLFNGSRYTGYRTRFQNNGHPYFRYPEPVNGSVIYDNVLYPNVPLLNNEVTEELIFQNSSNQIQLIKERISQFTIDETTFVNITSNGTAIEDGFFQVLYNGKSRLLKKEKKTVIEDISSVTEGIKRHIKTDYIYLIERNNNYYEIRKKKDILSIYEGNKKGTLNFAKSNGLNFRKMKDEFLVRVCEYNDQQISRK